FDIFNIFDDNEKILRAFPKPCVIKPIFGTSSHGVLLIESDFFDYKKISETIRATVNQEHRESFKRFHGNMLIEEYVPGKMISLDGFVVGGQISVIGSIEFIMGKEPYFTQVASYIPARLTEKEQEVINKYLKSIIETLGFINSPFHAEFRIKDGEPYLVEIAGRMAGALIHETYDRVYGIDMLNLMYDCWLGNSIPLNYFSKGINYHELFYPQIKHSGILKEISGLDSLKNIKNLCNVKIISEIGMELKTYPDLPTPLFEYSIFSKDLNEINNVIDTVNKLIKYKII
ncbi:MAG: ATP-grasp domain-containing protein, partial [Candidatus Paceibacterota bacterium]